MAQSPPPIEAPRLPIERMLEPLNRFFRVEAAGGIVLLVATITALVLANSPWAEAYAHFWHTEFGFKIGDFVMIHSLEHWVSDGLMTIFFFVVGLEIKREMTKGQLREINRAMLPIFAALGGMILPAAVYLYFQAGEPGQHGWGIPMATDIAFVVGILAILGSRVPPILRVTLLSLAIVDDIGAILVIAIGYTDHLDIGALIFAAICLGVTYGMNRIGIRAFWPYVLVGALCWIGFHESGVHATIAGVILGLMTPSKSLYSDNIFRQYLDRAQDSIVSGRFYSLSHRGEAVARFQRASRELIPPMEYLEDNLHPISSFLIMPLFALANAGVPIDLGSLADPLSLAIISGLVIGKPIGIFLLSFICVKLILKRLPEGMTWGMLFGGGVLAGIGFTMALFIASLALEGELLQIAKTAIIAGSLVAAIVGVGILLLTLPKAPEEVPQD